MLNGLSVVRAFNREGFEENASTPPRASCGIPSCSPTAPWFMMPP
ncbi:MAG: hypothetical protein ACLSDQ_09155 [Adlercreutzia equolifaciens]